MSNLVTKKYREFGDTSAHLVTVNPTQHPEGQEHFVLL